MTIRVMPCVATMTCCLGISTAWADDVPVADCVPQVRVDFPACISTLIYVCEGHAGYAWLTQQMVGDLPNVVLGWDEVGGIVREVGTDGRPDGLDVILEDPFEHQALLDSGEDEMRMDRGDFLSVASFIADDGYRFSSVGGLRRADMIGRNVSPDGTVRSFDLSAFYFDDIPVFMVSDDFPTAVVRAADGTDLRAGQECGS